MQATEQATVVLFLIWCNVVLAFEFVTENMQLVHTATVGGLSRQPLKCHIVLILIFCKSVNFLK